MLLHYVLIDIENEPRVMEERRMEEVYLEREMEERRIEDV